MYEIKISVIVPIYNAEKYLNKCLDSIVNQTYKNLEIILINDGSKDSSKLIIDDYASIDNRIIAIHKLNGGIGSAYNCAFSVLTGSYVCFVDSDDYIADDCIEKLMSVIFTRSAEIVHAGINYFDGNGKVYYSTDDIELEITGNENILANFLKKDLHPGLGSTIYKRELFNDHNFPEQNLGVDELTTLQILHKCQKIAYVKEKYYFCYQNQNSVSREKITVNNFIQRVKIFDLRYKFLALNAKPFAPYISRKFLCYLVLCNIDDIVCTKKEKQECKLLQQLKFKEYYKLYKNSKQSVKLGLNMKIMIYLFKLHPTLRNLYQSITKNAKKLKMQ